MTPERLSYLLFLISGLSMCLAVLFSILWHKLNSMTRDHWNNVRLLDWLESDRSQPHPSELFERNEQIEQLRESTAKSKRLLVVQDAVRVAGLCSMYAACAVGGAALVIVGGGSLL